MLTWQNITLRTTVTETFNTSFQTEVASGQLLMNYTPVSRNPGGKINTEYKISTVIQLRHAVFPIRYFK